MRFGLLRRFSHLIHHRTHSDPLPFQPAASPLDAITRSVSLDHIGAASVQSIIPPTPFSPFIANFSFSPPPTPPPRFPPPPLPTAELSKAQKRLSEVEEENIKLQDVNESLRSHVKRNSGRREHTCPKVENIEQREQDLKRKSALYQQFFAMMREIGLGDLLESGAGPTNPNSEDFQETVVDAILQASSNPDSPWSKIMPAVTGPQTSEHYLLAIKSIIKTRQDVNENKKVAKFWKVTAKRNGVNADLITPSSSAISEIQNALEEERVRVADVQDKRRSGFSEMRIRASQSGSSTRSNRSSTALSTSSSNRSSRSSRLSSSSDRFSQHDLPPLASQMFKEQLIASHSSEHFSILPYRRPSSMSSSSSGDSMNCEPGGTGASSTLSTGEILRKTTKIASLFGFKSSPDRSGFSSDDSDAPEFDVMNAVNVQTERDLGTILEESEGEDLPPRVHVPSLSDSSVPRRRQPRKDLHKTLVEDKTSGPKISPSGSMLPILRKIPRRLSVTLSPKKLKHSLSRKTAAVVPAPSRAQPSQPTKPPLPKTRPQRSSTPSIQSRIPNRNDPLSRGSRTPSVSKGSQLFRPTISSSLKTNISPVKTSSSKPGVLPASKHVAPLRIVKKNSVDLADKSDSSRSSFKRWSMALTLK